MKPKSVLLLAAGGSLLYSPAFAEEQGDSHHSVDEITVTALPLERAVREIVLPTAVLSGDQLVLANDTSIGETLEGQLGVSSSYFGPIASRPIIRGQFGERIQVLSNGLDVLDVSALSEDHAVSVDSLIAESVEIIRGPATLIYGGSAAGGVINVVDNRIRESALENAFEGAIALGADTATGAGDAAIRLDTGNDSFVAHFDYLRRTTENIEIPGFAESLELRTIEGELDGEPEGLVENTDSETETSGFGFSFLGDQHFLGFSVSNYDTNYGVPGHGHEHEEGEEEGEEEEEEEIIRIDLDQVRYEVQGKLSLPTVFSAANFRLAHNDYEHVELEGDEIGTTYLNDAIDLRLELVQNETDVLAGTIGLQVKQLDLIADGEEAFVPNSDTEQMALYTFQEFRISDTLLLQGSARIESLEISQSEYAEQYDDTAFSASAGLLWLASDTLSVAGNLALTERHPNATELYARGAHVAVERVERGSVEQGDGLLSKESSVNLDVTVRGEIGVFDFAVTTFLNDVDDYIVLSPTGMEDPDEELPIFEFEQTNAELYGIEAELLVDLIDDDAQHLHARIFTDFVHAEDTVSGEYLPRITPMRIGAGLHYTTQRMDSSVSFTRYDDQDKVASNELRTGGYTMVDAEFSYRFDDPNILLFVRGSNLGDEDARRHTSALKDITPLPGRSIRLGMRWDF